MFANGWQLNADFVLHKICDLGAVMFSVCVGRIYNLKIK